MFFTTESASSYENEGPGFPIVVPMEEEVHTGLEESDGE